MSEVAFPRYPPVGGGQAGRVENVPAKLRRAAWRPIAERVSVASDNSSAGGVDTASCRGAPLCLFFCRPWKWLMLTLARPGGALTAVSSLLSTYSCVGH